MRGWSLGLASLVVASGCLDFGGPAADVPLETAPLGPDVPVLAAPPVLDEPRALDKAPAWKRGEWWLVRLTDFTGETFEVKRVVAGVEGDNYLVGMPAKQWVNDFMVLHIPGFGEVAQEDLSYETHDVPYEPLRFPLAAGATWATAFEGRPVKAEVKKADGKRAEIEIVGDNDHGLLTYDAEVGEIVRWQHDNYATYEVVAHGFDFEGLVTVPHGHDLVFQHARFAAALSSNQPKTPFDEVPVDPAYDRVSLVVFAGTVAPDTNSPNAYYRETATAPDGKVFQITVTAADGPGLRFLVGQHDRPGGVWKFEHVAAGPGIAVAEGIAYHVYDVDLPSGRILPSKGEHAHGE